MNELAPNYAPGHANLPSKRRGFVAQQFQASPSAQSEQVGLIDLIRIFERRKLLIIAIVGIVTAATLVWQLLSPNLYRSTANVQVELIDGAGTNQADVLARNTQRLANERKLYRSRNSARTVVTDLQLHEDPRFLKEIGGPAGGSEAEQVNRAISAVLEMTKVQSEDGSDLIEVIATARSPELAADIANAFPAAVRNLKGSRKEARRQELLDDLNAERAERIQQAKLAAEELAEFRVENQILAGGGGPEDLAQINRIASEATSASALSAGSSAQSAGVSRASGIRSTAGATSAAVQQLQRQQAELNAEVARLSQTYGDGYPELARVRSELASVRSNLATEQATARRAAQEQANAEAARTSQMSRADASRDAARAGRLQSAVSALTAKAYRNATNTPLLEQLEQQAAISAAAVAEVADRITMVRSEKLVEGVTSNIISPATANPDPVSPSPLKTTMVALVGSAVLAMMVAFMIDMLDDRLRTVGQIKKYFGLPVFGMLPLLDDGIPSKMRESPVFKEPQSMFAEVARSMYSEVRALMPVNQSQSVLVTSPLPGDGKSVVALTMAAAAVAMGKRAVILDLDLRRSGILQRIQKDIDAPELMDVVRGHVDLHALIAPVDPDATHHDTGFEIVKRDEDEDPLSRFVLLSASQPVAEPAAVLGSSRFHDMVEDLKSRFDLVVVNAPAVLAVRDARSMCDFTDDTVLVARWAHTTIEQLRATLEVLGSGTVAGCVYNQVDYAEHARRRYGDSVQFYYEASDYFAGDVPVKLTFREQVARMFRGRSSERGPVS